MLFQTVPRSGFKNGQETTRFYNLSGGIETYNRFEGYKVDDCLPATQDVDVDDSPISSMRNLYRRSFLKSKKEKVKQNQEERTDMSTLNDFVIYNKILEGKSSEDFNEIQIQITPKPLLKKCRK